MFPDAPEMNLFHYILLLILCTVDGSNRLCDNKALKILTHENIPKNKNDIDLNECRILELGDRPFRNNKYIYYINLENNFIRSLSANVFQNLTQLENVYIGNNLLSIIDPKIFEGLEDISNVRMNSNYLDLTHLGNLFIGVNMTTVAASYNNRDLYPMDLNPMPIKKYVLDHVFGLVDVEMLYLSGNSYSEVKKDLFKNLKSLRVLELCDNKISVIERGLLDFNTNLEYLCLSDNRLKEIDSKMFVKNVKLLDVNLNNNELQKLPFDLFIRNVKLEMLQLSNNNFSKVNEANFYFAPTLSHLYLDGNNLRTIPEETFENNVFLKTIDLSDNEIEVLPEKLFVKNPKLQCVILAKNKIKKIPESLFKANDFLQVLQLSNNYLKNLDKVHISRRVRNILLDQNQFKTVPVELIRGKILLEWLHLDKNLITSVPWDEINALPNLNRLHISRNYVTRLPEKIFLQMNRRMYVNLAMNPFKCACINPYLPMNKSHSLVIDKQLFADAKVPFCIYDKKECDGSQIGDDLMTEWQDIMYENFNVSFTSVMSDLNQMKNWCRYF